jgi:hypothetical protein
VFVLPLSGTGCLAFIASSIRSTVTATEEAHSHFSTKWNLKTLVP